MSDKAIISIRHKGGAGSGHHGHAGRPGLVGGSVPGVGIGDTITTGTKEVIVTNVWDGVDGISRAVVKYANGDHDIITINKIEPNTMPVVYMHGTSEDVAESIFENGLRAGLGDDWGFGDDRPPSVYMTTDENQAIAYGESRGAAINSGYAIVEISIPRDVVSNVKIDEIDKKVFGIESNFRIEQDVLPEWISNIVIYNKFDEIIDEFNR